MKKRKVFILGFCFWVAQFTTEGYAQVAIYVAPDGKNSNPGTLALPLPTPHAALAKIRRAVAGDYAVVLRGGVYHLDSALNFNTMRDKSVTFQSYNKEKVTLSAARRVTVNWQPYSGGIWRGKVTGNVFEQLFVNGQLQHLARYPDFNSTARVFNGTAKDAIAPERIAKWKNPTGGYVHALHAGEWGGFHYRITGVRNGKLEMEGGWQNNRPSEMHSSHRFVENIFEELDAPGEWFYDRKEQLLYYYPPAGVDLAKARIEVSNLKHLAELRGTDEAPLKNITFKGIRFAHTERTFMEEYEPLLRSDWMIYRGGAVIMENTENCRVVNCEFTDLGGNALLVSGYNRSSGAEGSHFYRIGASAICFIGDSSAVRSPSFRYEHFIPVEKLDVTPGPRSRHFPVQCFAEGNLIHDIGRIEKQATGVQIEMASQIHVAHNTIYRVPRAGINIGDGAWGGHLIEFNDVFETVLETGDHGAFNSWGRDRFWFPNRRMMDSVVAVHPELILLDAQQTTVIRNNRFQCDHGWDIDLDDGSSNYHIYNNVCLNGGLKFREGFYRKAENNILINNSFHPHVWFKNSGDSFKHNIVMRPYAPIGIDDWGTEIDSNLFMDLPMLAKVQSYGTDRNSAFGDPNFINPLKGDYRVPETSRALEAGFTNFPMDQFGVTRPELKKLAESVEIPVLLNSEHEKQVSKMTWLGGKIRNVEGLGDRSAFGLPDATGVIVEEIHAGSLLDKGGLKKGDVIRYANQEEVPNLIRLMAIQQQVNWTGQLEVEVIRNQQKIKCRVPLK